MKRSMMKALTLSISFIVMTVANGVQANSVCGPHEKIVTQLQTGYSESRSGYGLSGNGSLVELFVSKEKGTWTFMLTRPDGMTCLVASGGNWEDLQFVEKKVEELM